MSDEGEIRNWLLRSWPHAKAGEQPFKHWFPKRALPENTARALSGLNVNIPPVGDTLGKRETHNSSRWFFSAEHQELIPVCGATARAFQDPGVVGMLQSLTGAALEGTSLRIEYCADRSGFWLEPHTDIGAKRFTALVYLTDTEEAESLGTDLYDSEKRHLGHAPGHFNWGLVFVPGADTWHGFRRRAFDSVRKSLIVNYVGPEWRARHELAFPDAPVAVS
jgi:hypothetical protein